MTWLDDLKWLPLTLCGLLLVVAPISPAPHLLEKLAMLSQGQLVKPLDVLDLLMHCTPLVLLAVKAVRQYRLKNRER